jgi:hypothetical protein
VAELRWASRLVALTPQPRTTSTRDGRLASAD